MLVPVFLKMLLCVLPFLAFHFLLFGYNFLICPVSQGEYGIAQLEHCVVTRMLNLLLPFPPIIFLCGYLQFASSFSTYYFLVWLYLQDTVFCKSILNEFAVKVNREKPTYNTVQSPGLLPVFISTLVFDGVSYTGDAGRNKKEAEQLAARAVILSLIGTLTYILNWEFASYYRFFIYIYGS
jgi:hypothetical protein